MWLHNSNWGLIFFLFFLSFFYSQLVKKRSPAVPCPGQTRTLACSLWMRRLWSTTLPLTQGERISMSFHPQHPNKVSSPTCLTFICGMWIQWFDVPSSQQCGDRAHKPCHLPGGWRCGCRVGRPAVHPQDEAEDGRLSSPCHPDPADGATANHEGWVEGRPLFSSFSPYHSVPLGIYASKSSAHCLVIVSWSLLLLTKSQWRTGCLYSWTGL